MVLTFNPKLVVLARQARGLSQADLADRVEANQGFLSKIENGLRDAPEDLVEKIARVLEFPKSFFYQQEEIYGLPVSVHPLHRKKRSVGVRGLDVIHAEANIMIMNLKRLLQSVKLSFRAPMPLFDIDEYEGDVERIAELTRRTWLLPNGPIENITECLERAGCIVIWCDFHSFEIDGITFPIHKMPVCIFLNRNRPADRMRFTLAHELGHIVMHKYPNPYMEDQADRFASSFLMPRDQIKDNLLMSGGRITIKHLAYLKPIWRVSMQSMIMRAQDIGVINRNQSEYLWKQINIGRIRFQEPPELNFPHEQPRLLSTILKLHTEKLGYAVSELAEVLHLKESEFCKKYQIGKPPNESNLVLVS